MEEITVWERIKKVKREDGSEIDVIVHNHIEPNWVEGNIPQPINSNFEQQKAWSSYRWKKTYAHLDQGRVR